MPRYFYSQLISRLAVIVYSINIGFLNLTSNQVIIRFLGSIFYRNPTPNMPCANVLPNLVSFANKGSVCIGFQSPIMLAYFVIIFCVTLNFSVVFIAIVYIQFHIQISYKQSKMRMQMKNIVFVLLICFTLTASSRTKDISINKQEDITQVCLDFDRSAVVTINPAMQNINAFLNIEMEGIIDAIVTGSAKVTIQKISQQINGPVIIFLLPLIICLTILLIIWPFLCCCCVCHCCCFCCKTNQNHVQSHVQSTPYLYSKIQMRWPVICLSILMMLAATTAIVGIIGVSSSTQSSSKNIYCTSQIIFDDLINGSKINNQQIFSGLQTFQIQASNILNGLQNIKGNVSDIALPQISLVITQLPSLKQQVTKIPSNSGTQMDLSYASPLQISTSTKFEPSIFPSILGASGVGGTLIGNMTITIDVINQIMISISGNASQYVNSLNQIIPDTQSLINNIETLKDSTLQSKKYNLKLYQFSNQILQSINAGLNIKYGLLLIAVILIAVASLLIGFLSTFKCRYLMYCACFAVWILAFLSCFVGIIMSVWVPINTLGCIFANGAMNNPQNFVKTFPSALNANQTQIFTSCSSSGDGQYIKKRVTQLVIDKLNQVQDNLNQVRQFITTNYSQIFDQAFQNITMGINDVLTTQYIDVIDTQSLDILKKISDPSKYGCSAPGFSSDSWIPSLIQSQILCKFPQGKQSNSISCPNINNFQIRDKGCIQCMDSTSFEQLISSDSVSIQNHFENRYPGVDCNNFVTQITNVWINYFGKKRVVLTQAQQRRKQIQISSYSNVIGQLNIINPALNNAVNTVDQIVINMTDPSNGVISGLDCRFLGNDAVFFKDVVCHQTFNLSFNLLLIQGIICVCLLTSLCLIVCIGVRSARQQIALNSMFGPAKTQYSGQQQGASLLLNQQS